MKRNCILKREKKLPKITVSCSKKNGTAVGLNATLSV